MDDNTDDTGTVDRLFVLPERVTQNTDLRVLYEELVASDLREVQHLPLTKSTYVLIERKNLYYIMMRERERTGTGYGGSAAEKSFKQHWLQIVELFNKIVSASDQKKHQKMLENVSNIVLGVLEVVNDDDLREKLVVQIASAFEEAGIS